MSDHPHARQPVGAFLSWIWLPIRPSRDRSGVFRSRAHLIGAASAGNEFHYSPYPTVALLSLSNHDLNSNQATVTLRVTMRVVASLCLSGVVNFSAERFDHVYKIAAAHSRQRFQRRVAERGDFGCGSRTPVGGRHRTFDRQLPEGRPRDPQRQLG